MALTVKIDPQLPEEYVQRGISAGEVEIQHTGEAHITVQQDVARVQISLKHGDREPAVYPLQRTAIRKKAGPYPLKPLGISGEPPLYDLLEFQGALHDLITGVGGTESFQNT